MACQSLVVRKRELFGKSLKSKANSFDDKRLGERQIRAFQTPMENMNNLESNQSISPIEFETFMTNGEKSQPTLESSP